MIKKPKQIDLKQEDVDALLKRVKNGALLETDYEIIAAMVETISLLSNAVDAKSTSIKRLLKIIFGSSTEKTSKITKNKDEEAPTEKDDDKNSDEPTDKNPKGHGRNSAASYTGADKIKIELEGLKPKDKCPECLKGKLYKEAPKTVVRITGSSPLHGTVYEMEKLRCNLCGAIFTAEQPPGIGEEKYDAESGAMIGLLKYGSGLPFNRLEQLQASLGVPLPASTQWDIVKTVSLQIYPVFIFLQFQAALGDVIYNDDTVMKTLQLMKENKNSSRKGMFTTGIVSTVDDLKIALFFTGRKHAGENLEDLLSSRPSDMDLPIQMCDALAQNSSGDFKTILAHCLVHARRNFVDIAWNFPEECAHVLEQLKEVYKNDSLTKEQSMSPEQRLEYHQKFSKTIMDDLYDWLKSQFDDKKVEPNSDLGKAINYMMNHWEELTLFLRVAGAPLDNNLCERAIKKVIMHRKNSLFFKTQNGAFVGDLFMSLIHTCGLNNVNPFDYLTELQKNSESISNNPAQWLPWNYKDTLQAIE